jgi:hypothetical protein
MRPSVNKLALKFKKRMKKMKKIPPTTQNGKCFTTNFVLNKKGNEDTRFSKHEATNDQQKYRIISQKW